MTGNFKVDNIVKTLKDLQHEKSCLEQKLRELRDKRKKIATEDEQAYAKLQQVKDVHAKMSEVQKVSQHKVIQSQSQVNQLEAINKQKRQILKDWDEKIADESERRLQEKLLFEKELEGLSQYFLEAKDYYKPVALQEQITKEQSNQKRHDIESKNEQKQIELLTRRLEELLLNKEQEEMAVTKVDQKCIMEALWKERRLLEESYKIKQSEIVKMRSTGSRLQNQLASK